MSRVMLSRSVPDMNASAYWVQAVLEGESLGAILTLGNAPGPVLKQPVVSTSNGAASTNGYLILPGPQLLWCGGGFTE